MPKAVRWSPEQLDAFHRRQRLAPRAPVSALLVKPSKHRAVRTTIGALTFDSKHEAAVWTRLLADERVRFLQRQVGFTFTVEGVTVGRYKADFVWRDAANTLHVGDAKSAHTRALPGWHRTRQLMLACYGIAVEEL